MIRIALAALAFCSLAAPAVADVTLAQTTGGKGLGMSGQTDATTYIKGLKMRSDVVTGNTVRSTVFDLEAQKMYVFDSKKKEADVWDMEAFTAELNKSVDTSQVKASLTPNGQTKSIGGNTAEGYEVSVSAVATPGGSKDMAMTVQLTGPVWVVKGVPGTADFVRFYKAAAERGWIFSDPRAAKGAPGQAKSLAEMYRQFAEIGGIPYETEVNIKIGGGGPMGAIMGRLGNVSSSTSVKSVDTTPLADEMFAPPAGYKLKPQK